MNPDVQRLAEEFVNEYLEREPEYLDVVEFVGEYGAEGVDPQEVHKAVIVELDTIAQRYGDDR